MPAGMEIGSMHIKGSFDTKDIDKGFTSVSSKFRNVKKDSDSVTSDFKRMEGITRTLAGRLQVMAGAGAMAMFALAKGAPAVAPAMAQINVAMTKLSMGLGTALQPVFEGFAGFLDKVATFVQEHPKWTEAFVVSGAVIGGLTALGIKIGTIGTGLAAIGTFMASPAGLVVLATLGAVGAGYFIGKKMAEDAGTSNVVNVPIGPAAVSQIENAGAAEKYDLINRYSVDIGQGGVPGGASQSPQIDPGTGKLISTQDMIKNMIAYNIEIYNAINQSNSNKNIALGLIDLS